MTDAVQRISGTVSAISRNRCSLSSGALDAPTARAEFDQKDAQGDEDGKARQMVGRELP